MTPPNNIKKHGKYVSIAITVSIVLMLILSGPAGAVTLGISLDNTVPTKGDSIKFTVTATINDPDTYVPIDNFSLSITGVTTKELLFSTDGTPISSGITVVPINAPSANEYGFGDRNGNDSNSGVQSFGYGYGYGSNNGAGGGEVIYTYDITLDTSILNTGSHGATLKLNTGENVKPSFSSPSVSFTVAGVSSSSGGSGTYPTTTTTTETETTDTETTTETTVTETQSVSNVADGATLPVSFTKTDVTDIEITVKNAASNVEVTVKKLLTKPTSVSDVLSLVKDSPGMFSIGSNVKTFGYLSMDVNIDDSNIDNAKVTFKVDKSWFNKNNIDKSTVKLTRYHDGWDVLPTELSDEDDDYVYYVATTPGFSTFAIIGEELAVATDTTPSTETDDVDGPASETDDVQDDGDEGLSGLILTTGLIGILALGGLVLKRKDIAEWIYQRRY